MVQNAKSLKVEMLFTLQKKIKKFEIKKQMLIICQHSKLTLRYLVYIIKSLYGSIGY